MAPRLRIVDWPLSVVKQALPQMQGVVLLMQLVPVDEIASEVWTELLGGA